MNSYSVSGSDGNLVTENTNPQGSDTVEGLVAGSTVLLDVPSRWHLSSSDLMPPVPSSPTPSLAPGSSFCDFRDSIDNQAHRDRSNRYREHECHWLHKSVGRATGDPSGSRQQATNAEGSQYTHILPS